MIRSLGALVACVLIEACEQPAPPPDPHTVRIVCDIRNMEVDFFAETPPEIPLSALMSERPAKILQGAAGSPPQPFVVYPESFSVPKGEEIRLKYAGELLSSGSSLASVEIFDAHTHKSQKLQEFGKDQHPIEPEVCKSWYHGCGFSNHINVATKDLRPGLYYAFLTDTNGVQATPVYFHVRPTAEEVAAADIVILLSEPTWYAYNFYAGGSLYGIHRTGEDGTVKTLQHYSSRLYAASMQRPLLGDPSGARPHFDTQRKVQEFFQAPGHTNLGTPSFDRKRNPSWIRVSPESNLVFSRFLRGKNFSTVTVAMSDIDATPSLLAGQPLLLVSGHNEYWTNSMITSVEDFVSRGGRIANFSGNVMWWQISIIDGTIYLDQIGHQRSDRCEEVLPAPFRGTGYRHLLHDTAPEKLFGVNYRFANYPLDHINDYSEADVLDIYGIVRADVDLGTTQGIIVTEPGHPIFKGLSLKPGDRMLRDVPLLAVELDGAPLKPDGALDRSFANDFPADTRILGTGSAFVATLQQTADGLHTYGGPKEVALIVDVVPDTNPSARTVSVGSIGVYVGLAFQDPVTERLVLNTIEYLRSGQSANDNIGEQP
jgi:hypothetical protein